MSKKIRKVQQEQLSISDVMLNLYRKYGWEIEETISSDVKARTGDGYTMTIEDGKCPNIIGALTFIYGQGGPVFEGRVETPEEVELLMKMLGFEGTNDKRKNIEYLSPLF